MSALLRAEWLKLVRQPQVLFWGFLAVPLFATLARLVVMMFVFFKTGYMPPADSDWLGSFASSFNLSGNAFAQLFFAIGVAAIFHVEYRYATWRQLVPRASRVSLWGAKLVFAVLCLVASLLLAALGDVLLNVGASFWGGSQPGGGTGQMLAIAASFSMALLEILVLAAMVSAVAIITRTMIGAALSAFFLSIGSSMLGLYLGRTEDLVPLPAFAMDALRSGLSGEVFAGLGVMLAWLAGCAVIGAATFARQALSSE